MSFPKRKEEKDRIWQAFRKKDTRTSLQIPKEYRLEVVKSFGQETLFLSFVNRILTYSYTEVGFLLGRGQLFLYGTNLVLTVYRGGTVEVKGQIEEVRFGRRRT